jgi:tetratricopeptide (TPR) repeat protein
MNAESAATGTSDSTDAAIATTTSTVAPGKSTRLRQRILLGLLMASVVGVGIKPAYDYWQERRARFYENACQQAVQAQAWAQLDAVASAWLKWDRESDDALLFCAEAAQQLGRPEDAAASLGRIDDDYEGVLQALAIRADVLFSDLNRPYDAIETWERMLRINPHADLARERLIYFYAMTMQREKMLEGIYEAMKLGCEPPEAYPYLLLAYEVMFSDGLRLTQQWMQTYPDDIVLKAAHAVYLARFSPDNTINIYGMSLITSGDETLVNDYLSRYPDNLEVLAYHLDQAVTAGEEQRVFELLSKCPAEAERDARFWRFRGWYLASQDRFAEAARALETAVEMFPYDWRSRMLFSGILRRLGRSEEGIAQAEIANVGKDLHRELLQLPNARSLNPVVSEQIDEYLRLTGTPLVQRAWQRRGE